MQVEHWRRVSRIFNAALLLEADRRDRFIEAECKGNEKLRAEIEALISAHHSFDSFIDSPIGIRPSTERPQLETGQLVGAFRVLVFIGQGGMGQVYLAEDERLGRRVALKLLPADLAADEDQRRRFQTEARAASALSHPNILTVFEVDFSEERPFIATEFIDGVTVREKLAGTKIAQTEAVRIASAIAEALDAAHVAGIIHRDVKPENIMLRNADGLVKLLDFGLAKPYAAMAKNLSHRTSPGLIIGTVSYMSPEQTRGMDVDNRSDLWSLGVVLYEMLSGQKPFTGSTPSHLIVNILDSDPDLERVPPELREVVGTCLKKDPDDRYASARDVVRDLKEATHARSQDFEVRPAKAGANVSAVLALILLALVVGAGLFSYYRIAKPSAAVNSFENPAILRTTTSGNEVLAAVSPDGTYIVHVTEESGRQGLGRRDIGAASSNELLAAADVEFAGLTFSLDGRSIFYTRRASEGLPGDLFQIASEGGTPKKILEGVDSSISFSPDGSRFTYFSEVPNKSSSLMIARTDGSAVPEVVAVRLMPDFFIGAPDWSADGSVIACPASSLSGAVEYKVVGISPETKQESVLTLKPWTTINSIEWAPDSQSFLMTARDGDGQRMQIWQVEKSTGDARRITNDLNDYWTISRAGLRSLAIALRQEDRANIWIAEADPSKLVEEHSFVQITAGDEAQDGINGLSQTSDNRVVFTGASMNGQSIWIADLNHLPERLFEGEKSLVAGASVSQDGRWMIYGLKELQGLKIWLQNLHTGERGVVAPEGSLQVFPYIAPDGTWIVYSRVSDSGKLTLRSRSLDSGAEENSLTDFNSGLSRISWDGAKIAFNLQRGSDLAWRVGIIARTGGEVKELSIFGNPSSPLSWTADNRALLAIKTRDGVSNVFRYSIDGSSPSQVTRFKKGLIFNVTTSSSGKYLVLSRGHRKSDLILIKGIDESEKARP